MLMVGMKRMLTFSRMPARGLSPVVMSRSSMNIASLPLASPGWISASTKRVGLPDWFSPSGDLSTSVEATTSIIGWPSALFSGRSPSTICPPEAVASFCM
ncbi:hypothetical protein D3C76_631770 [compost metagenome]